MKKNREFKLLILLCLAIAIGGCGYINESKSATDKMQSSEIEMKKINESLKSISKYIDTHVEGKKQSVFYEPETKKNVVQAELSNEEVAALYAKFDKNNINIEPIDGEFIGIMLNDKENLFAPK
ncbi:hypothetical protein MH215_10150 [Paenibacillus sp. ACRSA]|uniref:hypothetical protein n=1 Tax=Paenibacillus sp. ACRSA TaxID=2918211 RepID=UPI001EF6D994|nr:hypothetical protein [Paenibacillus sp. ACRSA]MCG7377357.1 hypothetical protein [Paenibacillus sp. ACRSA]